MPTAPTQCYAVLDYLLRNGCIDPMTALRDLGIYRLAARIYDLRAAGYPIDTEQTRHPSRTTYRLPPLDSPRRAALLDACTAARLDAAPVPPPADAPPCPDFALAAPETPKTVSPQASYLAAASRLNRGQMPLDL